MFTTINNMGELDQKLTEKSLKLIEFTASWCSQCKMMAPTISQIEKQFINSLDILLIDADKNSEIVKKYKILTLTTFLLIKNQEIIETFQMKTKSYISTLIENNLLGERK
jgi:thioredoxin 1